ncbi:hypothetical protein MLD38_029543 [Melastoma candidum]|uniref:Uncharacterized protein n=1 Tax=Melastoma candidum TaxID=119954 RepID=A0ACB9N575_9MYRT|nr:hypothetical protein MLD38_029543 [Melastoma candidum]
MAAISGSIVSASVGNPRTSFIAGSSLKVGVNGPMCLSIGSRSRSAVSRKLLTVRAGRDDGRSSNAGIFVGGFVLGGLIVGALGCVYAPQISKALAGANRRELMSRLPKFIYDEEKALERTRKILAEKIEQLNSAIDEVSAQLRADDPPNGSAVNTDEIEAAL